MKIGMITDSLSGLDFDALLATSARLELDMLEFGCGNWSSAPHLNLDRMLESDVERRDFKARLAVHLWLKFAFNPYCAYESNMARPIDRKYSSVLPLLVMPCRRNCEGVTRWRGGGVKESASP